MPAQQLNDEAVKTPDANEASPNRKSFLKSNVLILAILFVLALTEMLLAYFFILPSPQTVKASVEEAAAKNAAVGNPPYKPIVDDALQTEEREEVDLGEFTFTEGDPTSTPFRLSVHFYGLINKKDRDEYDKRYELHKNRIRNAILVILRSSQQSEITDPSLGLIKNKIMVKVNDILGMPLVKGIIYTDIAVQTSG